MINVKVEKTRILPELIHPGTAGSYKERIMLHFSEEWSGLSCKIDFFPVRGKPISVVWDDEAKKKGVKIPAEAMEYSGIADYVVSGYVMDGDKIGEKLISVTGHMKIDATRGEANNAVNPEMPTPNVYEQLRSAMIRDINEALERAKDSGEFDGEDGKSPVISLIEHSITSGGGYTVKITDPDGTVKSARLYDGNDGITPHIGENGNWFIGDFDTGVKASADERGVLYTPQALTDSQKSTARGNIGAANGIVVTASGSSVTVTDGAEQPLAGLSVFGKSLRRSVPSPSGSPVRISSVGGTGNTYISVGESSLAVPTPDGLLGIPVTGLPGDEEYNYIDGDGQRWLCDELDFVRGVHIRRVGRLLLGGDTPFYSMGTFHTYGCSLESMGAPAAKTQGNCLCNLFNGSPTGAVFGAEDHSVSVYNGTVWVYSTHYMTGGADELNAALASFEGADPPAMILYALAEPVETPISDGAMEQYRKLAVTAGECVIKSPSLAWLSVSYVADTKAYVDTHGGSGGGVAVESDPTVPDWAKQPQKPVYTASEVGALPADTFIPTKTSQLTNTSGFITNAVKDLVNYYTKSETYTKEEIGALVSAVPKFSISVVAALPSVGISETTVYLVKSGEGSDLYTEYIYVNGAWEILGSQRVDLAGYATEDWVNGQLSDYLLDADLSAAVNLALANAKASGEFNGEDGRSPEVLVIEHLPKDGGGVTVIAENPDGTTYEGRVYDGNPGVYVGSDTPPDGTKVQIDPDGEALEILSEAETKAIITDELAKRGQLKPEFAESVEWLKTNGDTSKVYVLPDGYIYACVVRTIEGDVKPNFKNLLDEAGYVTDTYLSSGNEGTRAGVETTGFIPFDGTGDYVVYLSGITAASTSGNVRTALYRENKTFIVQLTTSNFATNQYAPVIVETGADGNIVKLDYTEVVRAWTSANGAVPAFIRICADDINDTSVITVNQPITYTTVEGGEVYEWVNTGHAFVPADYEDRIIEAEERLEELSSDIATIETEVAGIKANGATVPNGVRTVASALVDKSLSRSDNRILRFLVSADAHQKNDDALITKGNKELGQAHGEILKLIGVDFVANLGDTTWGSSASDNATVLEEAKVFNSFMLDNIRGQVQIWTEGNHETGKLTESQIHGLIYSHNKELVQNEAQWIDGYGYMDIPNQKVRVIVLNTDQSTGNDTSGVSDIQLKWFAETALNMEGKTDWSVITMGHHPLDFNNITMIKNCMWVLEAFLNGANLDFTTNTGTQIAVNYSGKNCQYIAHFHGHAHAFSVIKMQKWVASETYEELNAWEICIPNACYTRNNQYKGSSYDGQYVQRYTTEETYNKSDVDGKRTSFNLVTICLDTKKIYADNYGAGVDREISY